MKVQTIRASLLAAALVAGLVAIVAPASGGVINEDFKLLASDGAREDQFGNSIAIDNGVVAVGADYDDDNGTNSGSAYLFDASTGVQIAKLLPSDGAAVDRFGISIAIDNGVVAVGAGADDDNGAGSGSAYLFDASTGAQIAKLLPDDGAEGDRFGSSIGIGSGVVAVGAPFDDDNGTDSGSAYLLDASTGAQIAKLLPNDGAAGDWFGFSVAINNGIVAVGARLDDDNGTASGSAYLFDASSGAQIAKLLPSDGRSLDDFGWSIAIDNGVVAVGATGDDDNGSFSGSAYLFDASTGAQIAKLLPNDGAAGDYFGFSIAINNGVVAVAAPFDNDNGSDSGSASLFDASTGVQIAKLLPSDGAARDRFGESIAIDNGVAAAGAIGDDDNGTSSGSGYVFDARGGECVDNGECDDGMNCTDDVCLHGFCVSVPNDGVCDDGLFCNGLEICDAELGCISTGDPCPPEQACDERTDSCRDPVGACCVGDGCLQDIEEGFCEDVLGGIYAGDFAECDEDVCDSGACCMPIGECVENLEATCNDSGGTFQGIGTDCGSTECPQPPGACCIDRACEAAMMETDCVDAGGAWAGPFTECDDDLCRLGACCFDGGSCEDMHPTRCEEAGGLFAGDETDCATWTCAEACCRESGECEDIAPSVCNAEGGISGGLGSTCAESRCLGACCFNGGSCEDMHPAACEADGGISGGLGSTCAESQCLGVCCINSACVGDQREEDCIGAGGRWPGPFTDCDDPNVCEICIRDPEWVCDGDVDGDGQVNPVDSGLVQAAFGSLDEQDVCNYDVDCDGQVNPVDSGIVQSLFGTCEAPRGVCP